MPIYGVLFIAALVTALGYATEIMLFVPVMWLLGRLKQPRLAVPSAIGAVIAPIAMIVFARIVGVGEYPRGGNGSVCARSRFQDRSRVLRTAG